MLRTHRAGKCPGGCGGWGLGSRNRRGPGVPTTPGLRGQGTSPGSPAGFLGSSGWDKCPPLLSCSSNLGGPLPPASPDLPTSLLCPQDPRSLDGALEGGYWPGSSAGSLAQVGQAIALPPLPLFLESPSRLPLLISQSSGVWILSGLHFSSPVSPPTSYGFTLGFLPSPWASESPTSGRQAP